MKRHACIPPKHSMTHVNSFATYSLAFPASLHILPTPQIECWGENQLELPVKLGFTAMSPPRASDAPRLLHADKQGSLRRRVRGPSREVGWSTYMNPHRAETLPGTLHARHKHWLSELPLHWHLGCLGVRVGSFKFIFLRPHWTFNVKPNCNSLP